MAHRAVPPLLSLILVALFVALVLPAPLTAQQDAALFDAPLVVVGWDKAFRHVVDLDNDPTLDVIGLWSTNGHDTEITTWVNDGTGRMVETWSTEIEHRNFGGTEPFTVGDLDGDGTDDFGIAISRTVKLYTGDGQGSFSLWREWNDPDIIGDLFIDDFNGDGYGDVVVRTGYSLRLHLSQGPGLPYLLRQRGTSYSSSTRIFSAEVNGDGKPDILTRGDSGVRLFPIVGDQITIGDEYTHSNSNTAAGDVDGDGDVDLVLFGDSGTYKVIRRTGPATFIEEPIKTGGPATHLLDVDGDGDPDGVCCGGGGGTRYNDRPSDFQVAINGGNGDFDLSFRLPGIGSRRLAGVADLDLDGDMDLVAGRCIYYARGPLVDDPYPPFPAPVGSAGEITDCDGDGDPDLEFTLTEVMTNDGAGAFVSAVPVTPEAPPGETFVGPGIPGDFTGNGVPDLIVEHWQGGAFRAMSLLVNTGGGGLVAGGDAATPGQRFSDAPDPAGTRVLDADLDGDLDLYAPLPASPYGRIWLNDGSGFFLPGQDLEQDESLVDVADVTGDSVADLLIRRSGDVVIRRGIGNGDHAAPEVVYAYIDSDADPVLADVTGDGMPDVVGFVNFYTPRLFANDGAGAFQEVYSFPSTVGSGSSDPRRIFITDVDGDGLRDVVVLPGIRVSNGATISLKNGPGVDFKPYFSQTLSGAALSDVDGDGDLDFLGEGAVRNMTFDGPGAGERRQYGPGLAGSGGMTPVLGAVGPFRPGSPLEIRVRGGRGGSRVILIVGTEERADPVRGGLVLTNALKTFEGSSSGAAGQPGVGAFALSHPSIPAGRAGQTFYLQAFVRDGQAPQGFAFTPGLRIRLGE